MAENNMMSLKVFLRDDGTGEARRFTVDASVVTSFIFMKEKLQAVFPNLQNTVFKITWKDSEGDEITIASDEDLITALTEMNSNVKVLYVTIAQHNPEPGFTIEADITTEPQYQVPRIICDICNRVITGFRYKCLQCPDYDLCANCEHQGHHSDHLMMRVPSNEVYMPKCTRKFVNHVTRNLKKSVYIASKEAHRAAKLAHQLGTQGKCGEGPGQATPSCSTQQPKEPSCPFTAGDGINLNDVHALGALARQHLAPILDVLRNAPASQTGDSCPPNDGLFMDIIRNAVDGFFGKDTEQPKNSETDKQETVHPTTPNSQSETPMDVEGAASSNKDNSVAQPDSDKRDPGWTFVANKPQAETVSNENGTQNQPSAPAFVYHENPRIAEGLVKLHEMGFSNESGYITHLLERFDGDVNSVVKAIVDMKL